MSRTLRYVFPAGNTTAVCLLQTLNSAGSLALNGTLANPINSQVSFISRGYARQISLTSANNLSGRTFTITGSQNGVVVIENLTGPNNNTVYSTEFYDVINSISVNGAAAAVSAGSGHSGFFKLIGINLERPIISYALSIQQETVASIPSLLYNTLLDITGVDTFLNLTTNSNLFEVKANNVSNNQYFLPAANIVPCKAILIGIEGSGLTLANSISVNFIQI